MHQKCTSGLIRHLQNSFTNDEYIEVDPDYIEKRPTINADFIDKLFLSTKSTIQHLDYGAGQGLLTKVLNGNGWNSTAYDPFNKDSIKLADLKKYDLITAFEVFEHISDVYKLMTQLKAVLKDDGIILFSTLFNDSNIKPNSRIDWWYASPRNGHISLFSKQSMRLLARQYGFNWGSFSHNVHLFLTKPPAWATHLFRSSP